MFELCLSRICFAQSSKTENHVACLVQKTDLSGIEANTRIKALKAHENYANCSRASIQTDPRSANQYDFLLGICPSKSSPSSVINTYNTDANQLDDDSSIASHDFSLEGECCPEDERDQIEPFQTTKTSLELVDRQIELADIEMTESISAALINLLPATNSSVIDYVTGRDMQLMCDHLLQTLCPRDSHITFRLDLDETFSGDAELPISSLFNDSATHYSGMHASNGERVAKGFFSSFEFELNSLSFRLHQFKVEKGIMGHVPLVLFKDSVRDASELTKVVESILRHPTLKSLVELRGVVSRFDFSSYGRSTGIPVFADKPDESHVVPLCSAFSKDLGAWHIDPLTSHDDFLFNSQNLRHNDVPVAFTQLKDILAQKFAANPEKIDAFLDGLKDTFSRYHTQLNQIEAGELPLRDPYDHNGV